MATATTTTQAMTPERAMAHFAAFISNILESRGALDHISQLQQLSSIQQHIPRYFSQALNNRSYPARCMVQLAFLFQRVVSDQIASIKTAIANAQIAQLRTDLHNQQMHSRTISRQLLSYQNQNHSLMRINLLLMQRMPNSAVTDPTIQQLITSLQQQRQSTQLSSAQSVPNPSPIRANRGSHPPSVYHGQHLKFRFCRRHDVISRNDTNIVHFVRCFNDCSLSLIQSIQKLVEFIVFLIHFAVHFIAHTFPFSIFTH